MIRKLASFVVVAVLSGPMPQQPGNKPPAFEIADIHPSPPGSNVLNQVLRGPFISGDRFELQNATLLDMIRIAYNPAKAEFDALGRRINQLDADKVVGGPSELDFNRFDLIAKAPAHPSLATMKVMLQTLLATRFKLAVHNGNAALPAYTLTAGKKPLLKEPDGSGESGCKQAPPATPGPGVMVSYTCHNMTMTAFADAMRSLSFTDLNNTPVVDRTGIEGSWNFDFRYSVPSALSGTPPADIVTMTGAVQKQLGLNLELSKAPMPVIIVDRASESPTPNPPAVARALPALSEAFEVADIKPTAPEVSANSPFRGGRIELQPGGRVVVENATLRRMIVAAWGLTTMGSDPLLYGPKFMDTTRFDIVAKAPLFGPAPDEPAVAPNTSGPLPTAIMYPYTNQASINPMLRNLLIQRFGLTFHSEDRPFPALTLTTAKPKLQKADPAHRTGCHQAPGPVHIPAATFVVTCENITMAQFAANLPLYLIGRLGANNVLDATGLEGAWDFKFTFSASAANPFTPGVSVPDNDPSGMTLFEAMEKQLGLKLEQTKRPGKVMVIDHLEEKPKEP